MIPHFAPPFNVLLITTCLNYTRLCPARKHEVFGKITYVKPETTYQNSRFDFYIECGERKIFIEVKGVTLENDGICAFPDAPTERGAKHLRELTELSKQGYGAYVLFVIQMENVQMQ